MRKFIVLFITVFSAFLFNSCEDKGEITEYKYKLTAESFGAKNIVIHEVNNNGDILKKHSIYEIKPNEYTQTFLATENVTGVWIYYKSGIYAIDTYYKDYKDFSFIDLGILEEEIFKVVPHINEEISQEEYEFYVNQ